MGVRGPGARGGFASLDRSLVGARLRQACRRLCAPALLCAAAAAALALAPGAGATEAERLQGELAAARAQAGSLAAELRTANERLFAAEGEATAAERRERRLTALLAEGREKTARLSAALRRTERRLAAERQRLRRARAALAARLVAIYETGMPDTTDLIFGSADYQDLLTRARYFEAIADSDRALADRVERVRGAVERKLRRVAELRRRALAYEARLAAAREEIASVREAARRAAARLRALAAERRAALAELRADIDRWVREVRRARAAEARAASEAEAEEEVGRWLGGPYAIPTYIVMCESGGNYSALNPSSGAGGAYQIIPSTWAAYGGKGLPHQAPKAEQDRIAAQIWADSGGSAWVCA